MKVNRRISESVRKMRELELTRKEIKELIENAYNCPGPILGKREALERQLKNFHVTSDPKRVTYGSDPNDAFEDYVDLHKDLPDKFTKEILYSAVFG